MELMTGRWTDDRMDDLKHQVDELGHRMGEGFADQRREMNARFDRLESSLEARFDKVDEWFEAVEDKANARFEAVDRRFEKMDAKFDAVHNQIACTQETVIGLYAMLSRFSLWFAGAMAVTVVAALRTLWLGQ
jgi:predicted nuclease with TOPRIM domain